MEDKYLSLFSHIDNIKETETGSHFLSILEPMQEEVEKALQFHNIARVRKLENSIKKNTFERIREKHLKEYKTKYFKEEAITITIETNSIRFFFLGDEKSAFKEIVSINCETSHHHSNGQYQQICNEISLSYGTTSVCPDNLEYLNKLEFLGKLAKLFKNPTFVTETKDLWTKVYKETYASLLVTSEYTSTRSKIEKKAINSLLNNVSIINFGEETFSCSDVNYIISKDSPYAPFLGCKAIRFLRRNKNTVRLEFIYPNSTKEEAIKNHTLELLIRDIMYKKIKIL